MTENVSAATLRASIGELHTSVEQRRHSGGGPSCDVRGAPLHHLGGGDDKKMRSESGLTRGVANKIAIWDGNKVCNLADEGAFAMSFDRGLRVEIAI